MRIDGRWAWRFPARAIASISARTLSGHVKHRVDRIAQRGELIPVHALFLPQRPCGADHHRRAILASRPARPSLRKNEARGDSDGRLPAEQVDQDHLAVAHRHSGVNCVEAAERAACDRHFRPRRKGAPNNGLRG